jgi:hypothetical protein
LERSLLALIAESMAILAPPFLLCRLARAHGPADEVLSHQQGMIVGQVITLISFGRKVDHQKLVRVNVP